VAAARGAFPDVAVINAKLRSLTRGKAPDCCRASNSDAFGLSLVTTNRMLHDLKAEQLIDYEKGKMTIRD
jgi:hypothetical protein